MGTVMKKGWIPAILVSMAVLVLLLMNTYGQQKLQIGLEMEGTSAGDAWRSYSPHLVLPRGEYRLLVSGYDSVVVRSSEGNLLGAGNAQEPFLIRLEKDESDVIFYGWQEGVLVSLELERLHGGPIYSDGILLSLGIAAAVLALGLARRQILKQRQLHGDTPEHGAEGISGETWTGVFVFCVLLGVTVLASYPLFYGMVGPGHDLNFHLYRIEGIKDGLLSGQFPVRLHPTHNNGYGYISSSVYPELFLYFPAFLRLLGASPVMAYHTFLVLVNGMTAWIMYVCAKGISRSRYAGLLASVLYTLSTWRIINLYHRAAIGEALAMMFFPVLLYGLYLLLAGDHRKWWVLALGCSGILQSHVISSVFAVLAILVTAAIYYREFLQKQRFLGFVKAGALTMLLNLWYLAAFLTYYLGADLSIKHTPKNTEFYQNAIFPTELFNLFNTSFGHSQLLEQGLQGNMSLSLGVGVTAALVICGAHFLLGKKEEGASGRFYGVMTGMGCALLFMASTLFPWRLLQRVAPVNAFCGTVQMPWRFLSLASPMFCIAAAGILARRGRQERKVTALVVLGVCSLAFIQWGTAYTTQLGAALKPGRAVDTYACVGYDNEYFLLGTDKDSLTADRYITGGSVELTGYYKRGTRIRLQMQNVHAGDWVEVPLLYYGGYEARDSQGRRLEVKGGDNHVVRIYLQNGAAWVELRYKGFWYFRAAELVSGLTLGACGICWWKKKVKREG